MPIVPKEVLCFSLVLIARIQGRASLERRIETHNINGSAKEPVTKEVGPNFELQPLTSAKTKGIIAESVPGDTFSDLSHTRALKHEEAGLIEPFKKQSTSATGLEFFEEDKGGDLLSLETKNNRRNREEEDKLDDKESAWARMRRDWEFERRQGQLDEKVPYEQHIERQLPWRDRETGYYPSDEKSQYPIKHPVDERLNERFEKWPDRRGLPLANDQMEERPLLRDPEKRTYPITRGPPMREHPRFYDDSYLNFPPASDDDLSQIYPWRRRNKYSNGDDRTSSERLAERLRNARNSPQGTDYWFDAETFMKWLAYKTRVICQAMVEILMAPMLWVVRWIEG